MRTRFLTIALAPLALLAFSAAATAEIAVPLNTDPNAVGNGFGEFNLFSDANIAIDDTGVFEGNEFTVISLAGSGNGGGGFSVAISNGENGIDDSEGGANTDVPNAAPVNAAISAVNGGGGARLQNGNVLRASVWVQQDPNDPITIEPSVEPVLKFELWKEAVSDTGSPIGDFTSGRQPFSGFGDRLWDTDINAPDSFYGGTQDEAARVDLNNDGDISQGDGLTLSLPPTTGFDEWVLLETTMVVDDTPDPNDTNGEFGWTIGAEPFFVDAVEEIRAVMFVGDFAGNDLTGGGSFFIDNFLFEVFADAASVTPNTNPMPEGSTTLCGDANGDGIVNTLDIDPFVQALTDPAGYMTAFPGVDFLGANDINDDGLVNTLDIDPFVAKLTGAGAVATPEPASAGLLLLAAAPLLRRRA